MLRKPLNSLTICLFAILLTACATLEIESLPPKPVTGNMEVLLNEKGLPECKYGLSKAQKKKRSFKKHWQAVNEHIIVIHSETGQVDRVRRDNELPTYAQQFSKVMEGYLRWAKTKGGAGARRMLLYFNGGLISTQAVKDLATQQADCILKSGIYPVFMAWSSSVVTSYGEQATRIRNGLLHEQVQPTAPLYVVSDILSSIIRAPQTWINESARFVENVVTSEAKEYSLGCDVEEDNRDRDCHKFKLPTGAEFIRPTIWKGDLEVLDDSPPLTPKRVFEMTRFGVTLPIRVASMATLLDPGKEAWNNMLRRTRNTVHHPGEFQPGLWVDESWSETPRSLPQGVCRDEAKKAWSSGTRENAMKRYTRGTGRFSRFFHDLRECIFGAGIEGSGPSDLKDLKLTLVGHSMGAIVINELVKNYPDLPYENIVYMAAAASIRDTRNALIPLLGVREHGRRNTDSNSNGTTGRTIKFYNLMLHPKADGREVSAFGMLPSGRLLEWIDEILEQPKTVQDRTMGKWRNLRRAHHVFPEEARKFMTFKVFGFDQRNWRTKLDKESLQPCTSFRAPNPTSHGAFNETEMEYWWPSFWGGDHSSEPWRADC